MDAQEAAEYREQIEAADSIDEWNRLDRELRARDDSHTPEVRELLRSIERASSAVVTNALMRALARDQEAAEAAGPMAEWNYDPADVDPDELFDLPEGVVRDFRDRLREAGRSGLIFHFSDLMDDPQMSTFLRNAEAERNIRRDFEGGEAYARYLERLETCADHELVTVLEQASHDDDLAGAELHHLTDKFHWEQNARFGELQQEIEDLLGTERLTAIARALEEGDMAERQAAMMEVMGARQIAEARRRGGPAPDQGAGPRQPRLQ